LANTIPHAETHEIYESRSGFEDLDRFDLVRFPNLDGTVIVILCTLRNFAANYFKQKVMTTAIVHHPVFRDHDTGPNHPESPSRYSVVMDALRADQKLWPTLLEVQAKEAPRGDIQACHTPQLYKTIERVVSEGTAYLDGDTVVSMRSLDAARYAAGAPCQAIDLMMTGRGHQCLCSRTPTRTPRNF
jgi:hypothetical protein